MNEIEQEIRKLLLSHGVDKGIMTYVLNLLSRVSLLNSQLKLITLIMGLSILLNFYLLFGNK